MTNKNIKTKTMREKLFEKGSTIVDNVVELVNGGKQPKDFWDAKENDQPFNTKILIETLIKMKEMEPINNHSDFLAEDLSNKSPLGVVNLLAKHRLISGMYSEHYIGKKLIEDLVNLLEGSPDKLNLYGQEDSKPLDLSTLTKKGKITNENMNIGIMIQTLIKMEMMKPIKEGSDFFAENIYKKPPIEVIQLLAEHKIISSIYSEHSVGEKLIEDLVDLLKDPAKLNVHKNNKNIKTQTIKGKLTTLLDNAVELVNGGKQPKDFWDAKENDEPFNIKIMIETLIKMGEMKRIDNNSDFLAKDLSNKSPLGVINLLAENGIISSMYSEHYIGKKLMEDLVDLLEEDPAKLNLYQQEDSKPLDLSTLTKRGKVTNENINIGIMIQTLIKMKIMEPIKEDSDFFVEDIYIKSPIKVIQLLAEHKIINDLYSSDSIAKSLLNEVIEESSNLNINIQENISSDISNILKKKQNVNLNKKSIKLDTPKQT